MKRVVKHIKRRGNIYIRVHDGKIFALSWEEEIVNFGGGGGYCLGHWKSCYERFHFDPLKCMAGFNVQCKKDWCVEI